MGEYFSALDNTFIDNNIQTNDKSYAGKFTERTPMIILKMQFLLMKILKYIYIN